MVYQTRALVTFGDYFRRISNHHSGSTPIRENPRAGLEPVTLKAPELEPPERRVDPGCEQLPRCTMARLRARDRNVRIGPEG
jgi:hypothetical protein